MTEGKTTYNFQTEARQVLEMMIYSVYSNKDIFLRELISNASDALDKLRIEALTNEDLQCDANELCIRLEADSSKNTLAVSDNGIGMNDEEVRNFIGTIARSGTKEYLEYLKSRPAADTAEELIGQFGVGFYSAFMVAEKVTLLTMRAGDEKAWKWESTGDGTYTLEEAEKPDRGTTVILELKTPDEEKGIKDYTGEWVIREIVGKYSDFVSYPIKMKVKRKKDGEKEEEQDLVLNSMKAIWARPEGEVSDEEFNEFYKHISHDWNEPWKRISMMAEGVSQFRGLFFIPSKASSGMLFREQNDGINLYIKKIFIMNDCKDLIPEYLRFVKGVIDSEDLPLNISREILQDDPQVRLIRRSAVRKILSELKKALKDDPEGYAKFWGEFGVVLKEGAVNDPDHRKDILDLALFSTTASAEKKTTLLEYMDRMGEKQKEIYYITGQNLDNIRTSPHLEVFIDKGYEVLLMADPVDELIMHCCPDYKDMKFVSAEQADVTPGTEEEKEESRKFLEEKSEGAKDLLSFMRKELEGQVKDVKLSDRLSSSPACLVTGEDGISPQMEQIMRAMGQPIPEVKRILEVNPNHPLFSVLTELFGQEGAQEQLKEYCGIIYDQAVLAEGGMIKDPAGFGRKIADLMVKSIRR